MTEKYAGRGGAIVAGMSDDLAFDLDSLAVDVFSLTDRAAIVESLTGAHSTTETAASCPCIGGGEWYCSGSCSMVEA